MSTQFTQLALNGLSLTLLLRGDTGIDGHLDLIHGMVLSLAGSGA